MNFAPTIQRLARPLRTTNYQKVSSAITALPQQIKSKRGRYTLGILLDIICVALILINGAQPAARLISPWVAPLYNGQFTQIRTTGSNFAFVPGWAQNKFDDVNFDKLDTLAFFDLPLDTDGSIITTSRGYYSFKSPEANNLFYQAHQAGTKVAVTLTLTNRGVVTNLLDDPVAQQNLINSAIAEVIDSGIDGVVIDFEPKGTFNTDYQNKFSSFIANLTQQMHRDIAGSQVTVAIPSQKTEPTSLFNLSDLSRSSDRLFVVAANFAVPELQNTSPASPVYGYDSNEYWNDVTQVLHNFTNKVSKDKLALERAWYGDGNNYPLYTPNGTPNELASKQPATAVQMDQVTLDRLVAGVPAKARDAAKRNIPLIAQALQNEGILNSNVLAYALATIEHETASTFEPIDEIQGQFSARRLGYEGGMAYHGRGFIQLTHLRNYRMVGQRIGMGDELARHPEKASDPETAAKVLAAFFKDNNVANLATSGQFVSARRPVNPDRNGYSVAMLAYKYAE